MTQDNKAPIIYVEMSSHNHIGQDIYFCTTQDFKGISDMGYLYNSSGKKLSDIPFRKGGLFCGFKDQKYCEIIAYPELINKKESFGQHVIINTNGEIVLSDNSRSLDYPYFHKGVIASIKQTFYNLITGKPIVYGNLGALKSENFLFVENTYNFGGHEKYKKGVYKIEWATGNYEIIN